MQTNLLASFHENTGRLLDGLSQFTADQFNKSPFEGSWTPGMVAQHLLKAETWAHGVLNGNTTSAERQTDEKLSTIESIFLNFEKKLKAPEFIIPEKTEKDREIFIQAIKANREKLEKTAGSSDLSLIYTDYAFPSLGELSGVEWINFLMCHSKRHIYQLDNIHKKLAQP